MLRLGGYQCTYLINGGCAYVLMVGAILSMAHPTLCGATIMCGEYSHGEIPQML